MQSLILVVIHLIYFLKFAFADTNDQTGANIDYGTFQNPSSRVRPRFRYWLPDASVDPTVVQADIEAAGAIGAGGVEFLPFYSYGGAVGYPPKQQWARYGFGTPEYLAIFQAALETHQQNGLVIDFPLGPNQGQGVPAEATDEGLQWDLTPYSIEVPENGTFSGIIPGWGTGEFVTLVSALVLNQTNNSIPMVTGILASGPSFYLSFILDHTTLEDLTQNVSTSGQVSLKFPTSHKGINYRLFAYFQHRTLHKNLAFPNNATDTIFDNGSYIVDHYSSRGAQTVTKFWENHILTNGTKELLMEVGNYGWEDSVEMTSNISWTPSLPAKFQQIYGYSLSKYLPVVMFADNNIFIQANQPGSFQCLLDTPDQGLGYINDFRGALVQGYREYLQYFTNWTNQYLNLQMSAQVSYNLPMDMAANIPYVNAPECESLAFLDNIDTYRQYVGPANLAGKRVISNEMGALLFGAFRQQYSELLYEVNLAFAAGVNQMVFHGQPYSGNYIDATWPGTSPFSYLFSEMHSPKQPGWDHGFSEILNYTARSQYILQTGVPKTDVAIYNKVSATSVVSTLYQYSDLVDSGYTYSYISPDNFELAQTQVSNGVLAAEGPSYKALVIDSSFPGNNLTLNSVLKLQQFAKAGLPIIISGQDPSIYSSGNNSLKSPIQSAFSSLKSQKTVYSVKSRGVAGLLAQLGIQPNIKVQTNGTWYPIWRSDNKTGIDYAFIFCDSNSSMGHIEVSTTKIPYAFDVWTGIHTPIFRYNISSSGVLSIPLNLNGNQTTFIAFSERPLGNIDMVNFHITLLPSNVIGFDHGKAGKLTLKVTQPTSNQQNTILLSNGKSFSASPASGIPSSFSLTNWTLTAEHWDAPANLSEAHIIAVKQNTTHKLTSPDLPSWVHIPSLVNVSGLGYYSSSFTWPPATSQSPLKLGAYISMPPISHAARLYINNVSVGPLDYLKPVVDITPYLKSGTNDVLIIVPTTMWNYLQTMIQNLRENGLPPLLLSISPTLPSLIDNGLVGEVKITPYGTIEVS